MADEAKFPTEVEFFFEFDKDYRIIAANGAWGGITTRGDIQLDFFVERLAVPESIKSSVTKDGHLGDEISRNPPKQVVRRLQIGVLLSPEQASNLAVFLNERLNELKKIKELDHDD